MAKIVYWAASLHSEERRQENERYAGLLKEAGYEPRLPQWGGVWEDMLREAMDRGAKREEAIQEVKKECFLHDRRDMNEAHACILYAPTIPSEGACFEFGYMYATRQKHLITFCPNETTAAALNLMISQAAGIVRTWDEVITYLDSQDWPGDWFIIREKDNGLLKETIPPEHRGLSRRSSPERIGKAKRWCEQHPGFIWEWV